MSAIAPVRPATGHAAGAFSGIIKVADDRANQRVIDEGAAEHSGGIGMLVGEEQRDLGRPRGIHARQHRESDRERQCAAELNYGQSRFHSRVTTPP
jgi:hypothetical protein